MSKYKVSSFGYDCWGGITGYQVHRYIWRRSPLSIRADGMIQEHDVIDTFVGNIYEQGSFVTALNEANALCELANRRLEGDCKPDSPDVNKN